MGEAKVDVAKFVSFVSGAQDAFVRIKGSGVVTKADDGALRGLAGEAKVVGNQLVPEALDVATPHESYLRDTPVAQLCDDGWLVSNQWKRNIETSLGVERAQVAAEAPKANGLWWLAAIANEIVARPSRKTAGGLGGGEDLPQGTPPWASALAADVKAILAKVNKL